MLIEVTLVLSAFLAGVINSVAGGGTFFTFPALLWAGVPPINANATSSLAVFPGSFSSAYAYREDFKHIHEVPLWAIVLTSLLGGWIGSAILLATPQKTFVALIPWLLLGSTLLFAFGKQLSDRLTKKMPLSTLAFLLVLLLIGFYGGYFGAGMGILTLALLSMLRMTDLNSMNAIKTISSGLANVAAVANFIACGAIYWHLALIMAASATAGGYVGACVAKKVNQAYTRSIVIVVGFALTAYFFWTGAHN